MTMPIPRQLVGHVVGKSWIDLSPEEMQQVQAATDGLPEPQGGATTQIQSMVQYQRQQQAEIQDSKSGSLLKRLMHRQQIRLAASSKIGHSAKLVSGADQAVGSSGSGADSGVQFEGIRPTRCTQAARLCSHANALIPVFSHKPDVCLHRLHYITSRSCYLGQWNAVSHLSLYHI